MTFSNQQCLWLAAALDYRSADGGLLSVAELQLFARYIQLGGDSGRSAASNAELVEGLSARRRGHPAHRKAFAGADGARHSLEQRGLIGCTRAVRSMRNPRTSALMVTPWQVTITADSEHVRPFAFAAVAEWIGRMLDEAALPSHARQIALRLARALDATGQLAATRKELEELLDVHRGTALKGLRLLETRGLVSLREDRSTRPAVFTIRAQLPAQAAADGSVREPRPSEEPVQDAAAVVEQPQPSAPRRLAAAHDESTAAPVAGPTRKSRGKYPPRLVSVLSLQGASAPAAQAVDDEIAVLPSAAATPPEPPPVSTDAAIGTESGRQLAVGAAPTNPAPGDAAPAAPTARGPRDLNALQVEFADPSDPVFQRELLSLAATHKGKVPLLLVGLDGVGAFPLTGPGGAPVKVSPTWELADAVRELRQRLLLADTA